MNLSETVITSIRVILAVRNQTQSSLSKSLGKNPMWLNSRLNGDVSFDTEDIAAIASALNVPFSKLISGELIPVLEKVSA